MCSLAEMPMSNRIFVLVSLVVDLMLVFAIYVIKRPTSSSAMVGGGKEQCSCA
jgi:hypothetical protein